MKYLAISITILCGLALITLIYGLLNNWAIPLTTILTWSGACVLCSVMVIVK